jgi:DNA-binding NtrC family response regulator
LEPFAVAQVSDIESEKMTQVWEACHNVECIWNALLMAIILIVEDDALICMNAEILVEDLGHGPLLAYDLASALLHLGAPYHIDALFVDIRLAALVFGGYEVANHAIALRPSLRVLYTSGTPLSVDMTDRFVKGGHFLPKPYSPQQFEYSIGQLLS